MSWVAWVLLIFVGIIFGIVFTFFGLLDGLAEFMRKMLNR